MIQCYFFYLKHMAKDYKKGVKQPTKKCLGFLKNPDE